MKAAPRQSRAKETVARIQSAAREILLESGSVGLNTNLIADRAGVNIATVYRYYPDKFALLRHLFEEFETGRREYVLARIEELGAGEPWRPWVRSVIRHLAGVRQRDPSGVALRLAMASAPELLEVDRASSAQIAQSLGNAFRNRFPHLSEDTARTAARLAVETITNGLDAAYSVTPADDRYMAELEEMIEAYLSLHLGE